MQFGYFDDQNREYVITRPDTPLPWINYLGNEDFFGIISNTGGGYSFYKDARLRRLTRYRYNNAPMDGGGRFVYLRDQDGEFWSPTWQPVHAQLENYTCRHGMGYSIISSRYRQISTEMKFFVPPGQTLEVWDLAIKNERNSPAVMQIFSAVEFCLWDAHDDATNFQRNYSIGEVEVDGSVIYHKSEYRERRNHFAYFACSEPLAGFDTQRDDFLGPYQGWNAPRAVKEGRSQNTIAHGWQPVGSHNINITLQPGESKRVIFLLGYFENPEDRKFDPPSSQTLNKKSVKAVIEKFLDPGVVDVTFDELNRYWIGLTSKIHATTPDKHVNRMLNIWNAYQCMVTFNMSRSASLFESGIGRGMGFRDSNQDLLGIVHMVPGRARGRILDLAATQMETGGAYHQYQTLTKRGNNAIGSDFNDDPLWLVLATSAYIKETGDWSILDELVPYENHLNNKTPLYDHLARSIQFTLERLGPHNLPLIGRADWNDCLNLNCYSQTPGESFQTTTNREGKIAESIFIGGLFVLAADEMSALAAHVEGNEFAAKYRLASSQMTQQILAEGWDGEWFKRAYDAQGNLVGSNECAEGKIFIEPQGMCIMAGIGLEDGKAQIALNSVNERLSTSHGIVLLQPPFSHYSPALGEISSYPPGYKENGGVFCHSNPWIMIAEVKAGNPDRALEYYLRINPSARESISEIHRCEPYVYAQMIAGKDAPTHGEAKNSWLTGTAAWNYVALTQYILGIRPELNGLRIAPALPGNWDGFSAVRIFRGICFNIDVKRRGPGNSIKVVNDGKPLEGTLVPLPENGEAEVNIQVYVE